MKTKFVMILSLLVSSVSAQLDMKIEDLPPVKDPQPNARYSTKKMTINAVYNGKNVFVQNSFGKGGIGFCITQVKVNENTTTDEINATSFKVNLELHKLKIGEKFKLIVYYRDSCGFAKAPLLLNPGAIMPRDPSGNNVMKMEGTNWSTNLLVTNPRSLKGNYGVKEVLVNGKKVDGINADVFEIPFYDLGIKYEEKVNIEYKFEGDCDPFIMNPEVINW